MQKIWAVFIVASCLSCCSIIHTFSLREVHVSLPVNNTKKLEKPSANIVDRTKKLATDYMEAIKKVVDAASVSDTTKMGSRCSHNKLGLVPGDLSNYDQLVIMKKYPYLDIKELDNLRSLPSKNARQSLHSDPTLGQDSNFCESSVNDVPSVDITNRGLTGFAIPTKLMKTDKTTKNNSRTAQLLMTPPLLKSLEKDVLKFVENMHGYANIADNK